jgi:hypothetical protein
MTEDAGRAQLVTTRTLPHTHTTTDAVTADRTVADILTCGTVQSDRNLMALR